MTQNKEGSFRTIFIFMIVAMLIAMNWNKWTWLKDSVHSVFDPSIGALLDWQLTIGMLIIVFFLAAVMTFVQKYTTNQKELKEIKKIQKELQAKQKEHRHDPAKSAEISKEMMSLMPKQMKLGMRTVVYTTIPFIIFFQWFRDYFGALEEATGAPVRFLGFLSWFWFYLLGSIAFSSFLKKKFDVV
jgi:uncharacterized membrane protein (DUF106 family)